MVGVERPLGQNTNRKRRGEEEGWRGAKDNDSPRNRSGNGPGDGGKPLTVAAMIALLQALPAKDD